MPCSNVHADAGRRARTGGPKSHKSMETLKAMTAKLGASKLEGKEAVGGKDAPALYFGTTKINNNFDIVDAVGKEDGKGMTATLFVRGGDGIHPRFHQRAETRRKRTSGRYCSGRAGAGIDQGGQSDDHLIVLHSTRMPAVLLEAGSIINRQEELELAAPERRSTIAQAVTAAVEGFCASREVAVTGQLPPSKPASAAITKASRGIRSARTSHRKHIRSAKT